MEKISYRIPNFDHQKDSRSDNLIIVFVVLFFAACIVLPLTAIYDLSWAYLGVIVFIAVVSVMWGSMISVDAFGESFKAKDDFKLTHRFFENVGTPDDTLWGFDSKAGTIGISKRIARDQFELVYFNTDEIDARIIHGYETEYEETGPSKIGSKVVGGLVGGAVGATVAGAISDVLRDTKERKGVNRIAFLVIHKDTKEKYEKVLYDSIVITLDSGTPMKVNELPDHMYMNAKEFIELIEV
jgi:hypothetical protein